MDIIKEGTHTYLLRQIESGELQDEETTYYLSVEYEVLRRNSLKMLLPVQLREQDEKKTLLFDITERRSLKILGKSRRLSQKSCKKILQSIVDLIQELDDYMLDLNNIEFLPEYIYEDAYGELQWIYFPGNLQNSAEALFEWMLTQIDYEDNNTVRFIYGIYNKIRKLGFSKELLERYLSSVDGHHSADERYFTEEKPKVKSYKTENKQEYSGQKHSYEYDKNRWDKDHNRNYDYGKDYAEEGIPYEEFFKEELAIEKQRKGQQKEDRKEQVKEFGKSRESRRTGISAGSSKKNSHIIYTGLNILLGIVFIILVLIEGIWIFSGITGGFTEVLFRYCIGGILLIAAIIICIWKCTGKLRQIKEYKRKNEGREKQTGIHSGKIREQINRPLTINTDVEWDTESVWDTDRESDINREWDTDREFNINREWNTDRESDINREWNPDREGTTILNRDGISNSGDYTDQNEEEICPMLRDTETGIIYMIKNSPFYIGSAEGVNQLRIPDKTVSREHAVILESLYENGGEGYILRDLNSTNGTWIDGKRMKKGSQKELKEGATIRFADREYRFLIHK